MRSLWSIGTPVPHDRVEIPAQIETRLLAVGKNGPVVVPIVGHLVEATVRVRDEILGGAEREQMRYVHSLRRLFSPVRGRGLLGDVMGMVERIPVESPRIDFVLPGPLLVDLE
jgi:hypothetical protein